jgi:hypothetical protein
MCLRVVAGMMIGVEVGGRVRGTRQETAMITKDQDLKLRRIVQPDDPTNLVDEF